MAAFRCYNPSRKRGQGFHAWLDRLPPEHRAAVDFVLTQIQAERNIRYEHHGGLFKVLRGKCLGITEIKIDFLVESDDGDELVHIRILGFETSTTDFTLLHGFRKFGGPDYGPACRTALNRKQRVNRDGSRARPCTFP
jgi:hypothetical protein